MKVESDTLIFGSIVKRYQLPLNEIEDLNKKYEDAKSKLKSWGPRLAGRLETELEFSPILQSTQIFKNIVNCMDDYMLSIDDVVEKDSSINKKLNIISCWINDMKEGEYNPPHTHHDLTGWSTVMFLKVPEFVNDVRDSHKFKDGQLGFISRKGVSTHYVTPKVGDFYIFEAKHQHCVMPFKTKIQGEIRRSMSFNFIQKND